MSTRQHRQDEPPMSARWQQRQDEPPMSARWFDQKMEELDTRKDGFARQKELLEGLRASTQRETQAASSQHEPLRATSPAYVRPLATIRIRSETPRSALSEELPLPPEHLELVEELSHAERRCLDAERRFETLQRKHRALKSRYQDGRQRAEEALVLAQQLDRQGEATRQELAEERQARQSKATEVESLHARIASLESELRVWSRLSSQPSVAQNDSAAMRSLSPHRATPRSARGALLTPRALALKAEAQALTEATAQVLSPRLGAVSAQRRQLEVRVVEAEATAKAAQRSLEMAQAEASDARRAAREAERRLEAGEAERHRGLRMAQAEVVVARNAAREAEELLALREEEHRRRENELPAQLSARLSEALAKPRRLEAEARQAAREAEELLRVRYEEHRRVEDSLSSRLDEAQAKIQRLESEAREATREVEHLKAREAEHLRCQDQLAAQLQDALARLQHFEADAKEDGVHRLEFVGSQAPAKEHACAPGQDCSDASFETEAPVKEDVCAQEHGCNHASFGTEATHGHTKRAAPLPASTWNGDRSPSLEGLYFKREEPGFGQQQPLAVTGVASAPLPFTPPCSLSRDDLQGLHSNRGSDSPWHRGRMHWSYAASEASTDPDPLAEAARLERSRLEAVKESDRSSRDSKRSAVRFSENSMLGFVHAQEDDCGGCHMHAFETEAMDSGAAEAAPLLDLVKDDGQHRDFSPPLVGLDYKDAALGVGDDSRGWNGERNSRTRQHGGMHRSVNSGDLIPQTEPTQPQHSRLSSAGENDRSSLRRAAIRDSGQALAPLGFVTSY